MTRARDEIDTVPVIFVAVTRTGGIAGIARVWSAEPPAADAEKWAVLIDECPWDADDEDELPRGADRFVWSIRARYGDDERRADLPDRRVHGPWRTLIDEVRVSADSSASA